MFGNFTITFNLTDSVTGVPITTGGNVDFSISCDNGFTATDVFNPYNATNFGSGIVECTFFDLPEYFDDTLNITANESKTIDIPMSKQGQLTQEEHDWLEAVYNCVILNVSCSSHFN